LIEAKRTLPDGGENGVGEALQDASVDFGKCVRIGGESLDQSDRFSVGANGRGEDGANAERAATVAVDTGIGLGIVTAQEASGFYAFAGETGSDLQARADGRRVGAGAGATDHEVGIFFSKRDGSSGGADEFESAIGNQFQRGGKIGAERFDLPLHDADGGESVGIVRPRRDGVGESIDLGFTIRDSGHHVDEQPFAEARKRIRSEVGEAEAGATGVVGPDHLSSGVDLLVAIGEIEAEIELRFDLEGRMALDGHPVFADVYDLVEVEPGVLRIGIKTGIGRRLNFVPDAPTPIRSR